MDDSKAEIFRSVNTDLLIEVSDTGVGIPGGGPAVHLQPLLSADPSRSQLKEADWLGNRQMDRRLQKSLVDE